MEKVCLYKCTEYDKEKIKKIFAKALDDLGGINKFIDREDIVLLKVNLLMKKTPEEATTTHPIFVEALTEIIMETGAKVIIGDSPGGVFMHSALKPIYKSTGMEDVAKRTGAELNWNVESFELKRVENLLLKKFTATDMLNDATKVISLSKLKTHGMMTFTGAVKNQFGIIPGLIKREYHLNMPKYEDFARALVDICLGANPILCFMDGIIGMEGEGPSAGNPRQVNSVLVSESPYHLDKVACRLINLDYSRVPTIKECASRNLCTLDLSDVEIVGEKIKNLEILDYNIPVNKAINPAEKVLPEFLNDFIEMHMKTRPEFDEKICVGCEICEKSCPADAITMNKNNKAKLEFKKCIRCFCCHELCPKKAVKIKTPLINKVLEKMS